MAELWVAVAVEACSFYGLVLNSFVVSSMAQLDTLQALWATQAATLFSVPKSGR